MKKKAALLWGATGMVELFGGNHYEPDNDAVVLSGGDAK